MTGALFLTAWLVSLVLPAGAEEDPHAHHGQHGAEAPASAAAQANRARETAVLDRFQDVAEAERAGYVKPGKNDGFQMGEHWYRPHT